MSLFNQLLIDIRFAGLISSRLDRFKIKQTNPYLAQLRCPFCGDSQKDKSKARGYLYTEKSELKYKCHNCNKACKFSTLLSHVDTVLHKEWVYESFKKQSKTKLTDRNVNQKEEKQVYDALAGLRSIAELPDIHPARKYVLGRCIPETELDRLYYCPKFTSYVNSFIPGKLSQDREEPRLLIPFRDKDGHTFGFQGRSFRPNDRLRYITIMLEDRAKCFGLDRWSPNRRTYVVEGPLDSTLLPNGIAVAQSDLTGADHYLGNALRTYIPDADRRNNEILKQIQKLIKLERNVCLLPKWLPGKDLNEAVQNGILPADLKKIIDEHTYTGLRLQMELTHWRKD